MSIFKRPRLGQRAGQAQAGESLSQRFVVPSTKQGKVAPVAPGDCRPVSVYQKMYRIGQGAYGTVYQAKDKETGEIVALKRVILHNEKSDGFPITSVREIKLLKRISAARAKGGGHENIVQLLEIVVGKKREGVFLVFEYCEHDLGVLIDEMPRKFSESEVKCILLQLLSAVNYLHSRWIIHRDLKMSNILYNGRGQVKLADFGLARSFTDPPEPMTQKVVTLWYVNVFVSGLLVNFIARDNVFFKRFFLHKYALRGTGA